MMKGFEKSEGAKKELYTATSAGLEVYLEEE